MEISANLNSMLNIDAHFFFKESIINEVNTHKTHNPFISINIYVGHKDCYILYTKSLWNKLIKAKGKGNKSIKNSERNLNSSKSQREIQNKDKKTDSSQFHDDNKSSFLSPYSSKTFRAKDILSIENIHSFNFNDLSQNQIKSNNSFYTERKDIQLKERSFFLSENIDLFQKKNSNYNFASIPFFKIKFQKKKTNCEIYSTEGTEIQFTNNFYKPQKALRVASDSISTIPILNIEQIKDKVNQSIQTSELKDKSILNR